MPEETTQRPHAPSHGGAALLSFVLTLLVGHGVVSLALPGLVRLLERRVPWYAGERLSAGLPPDTRPRVAVIGSSLSGISAHHQKPTLARALGAALHVPPEEVLNLSEAGRNVADLFAELLRAKRLGAGAAFVELNPFIVNDRIHRLGKSRAHLLVTTETQRAVEVFPWVRPRVQVQAARQIGAEGWLEALAQRSFAPYRLHVTWTGDRPSSSVIGGLVLGRHLPAAKPNRAKGGDARETPRQRRAVETICKNFSEKPRRALDTDVLADMMAWARTSGMAVRFFVPPLNQSLLTRCGPEARRGLDGVLDEMRQIALAQGAELTDLSSTEDDPRGDVFRDYGHFRETHAARGFASMASRLAPLVDER